jgi:2'-5' RNA ligase
MRIFLALPIPERVRQSLAAVASFLKGQFPSFKVPRTDSFHFTLFFFGEKNQEETAMLVSVLNTHTLSGRPIAARWKAVGTFPPAGVPRVVYADVGMGSEEIISLQQKIGLLLKEQGVTAPEEKRPFRPHLTLARNKGGAVNRRLLNEITLPQDPFVMDRCVLFQSVLNRDGAVYHPLAERVWKG